MPAGLLFLLGGSGAWSAVASASLAFFFAIELFVSSFRCALASAADLISLHAEPGSAGVGSESASSLSAASSACSASQTRIRCSACSLVAASCSAEDDLAALRSGLIPIPASSAVPSLVLGDAIMSIHVVLSEFFTAYITRSRVEVIPRIAMTHRLRFAGDPILSKICREVSTRERPPPSLLKYMKKTLEAKNAMGISAPQVGESLRLFMVAPERSTASSLVVNPRLLKQSRTHALAFEGCMSVPGFQALVSRPRSIIAAYTNFEGADIECRLNG